METPNQGEQVYVLDRIVVKTTDAERQWRRIHSGLNSLQWWIVVKTTDAERQWRLHLFLIRHIRTG